jgi:hypothetical protein
MTLRARVYFINALIVVGLVLAYLLGYGFYAVALSSVNLLVIANLALYFTRNRNR